MSGSVNGIKYQIGGSLPSGAARVGNYLINAYATGPTQITEYWNTYEVPFGQYTIYIYKGTTSQGPAIYACQNDSQLIFITNTQVAGTNFTTVAECINYYNGQTDKILVPGRSNVRVMIGGGFTQINSSTRNYLGRTFFWGEVDEAWASGTTLTGFDNTVIDIKPQSTGKQIVVGFFTSYNGVTQNRICRLNVDGSLDTTFNSSGIGFNGGVERIWVNSDDTILVVGSFTSYNGISANRIIKLSLNGSIDGSFSYGSGFNSSVTVVEKKGTYYYLGGSFTTYNGISYLNFIVLDDLGSVIGPNVGNGLGGSSASSSLSDIKISSDLSYVYLVGNFNLWNGGFVCSAPDGGCIAKIRTSTWTLDPTFRTNIGSATLYYDSETGPYTLVSIILDESLQTLYVGGNTTGIFNGVIVGNLYSLDLSGNLNTSFNNLIEKPNGGIRKIQASNVYSDYLYIMGSFGVYGNNSSRYRFAVISKSGLVIQTNVCSTSSGPVQEPFTTYDFLIS
jgi:hypothetical protein